MTIRAVAFDLDDTLYLEREYVRSGFHAVDDYVKATYGIHGFGDMCWRLFVAGQRGLVFNQALIDLNPGALAIPVGDLVSVYRMHFPSISLRPDIGSTLARLRPTVRVGVVTGGHIISQVQKVHALKIAQAVDTIVYAGCLGTEFDKPHAWAWRAFQASVRLSGPQIAYVGDNPDKDFAAPVRLGWQVVRLRQTGSLHEESSTPTGIAEASTLVEALSTLGL